MVDINSMGWVAIIGSREPTAEQEIKVIQLIEELDPNEVCIISGCAYGIDQLALQTGYNLGFQTIGVLPWSSYNQDVQKVCHHLIDLNKVNPIYKIDAYDSVIKYHPAAKRLGQGAMKLHARNYLIISWAIQVIAAPSNKVGGGGTGQGIRLAENLSIPTTIIKP